jgi:hypothetical protein
LKKFDESYIYLEDMYNDSYFPRFLTDKVRDEIVKVVKYLEEESHTTDEIQKKFDEMTVAVNELQEEFYENESEIETVARDSIGMTVDCILKYFNVDIDGETAIRKRDW